MYVFMHKYFLIGNFYFELIYPDILTLPEHFMLFETDRRHIPADYRYQLSLSGHFPAPEGICIVRRPDMTVFRVSGHLECRYIGISGIPGYYGCCQEHSDLEARIFLHPDRIENLNSDPVFVSLFALERRMSAKNALILHCAYIRTIRDRQNNAGTSLGKISRQPDCQRGQGTFADKRWAMAC